MNRQDRERAEDDAARTALVVRLREHRSEQGLSQRAVAKKMGTIQSAVSELEHGTTDPRLSTLQRFARAIGGRIVLELEVGEDAVSPEDRQIDVMLTLTRAIVELTDVIGRTDPSPDSATHR